MTNPYLRRSWKLRALKAFARRHQYPLNDVRRTIGEKALNNLLNEVYTLQPDDPAYGADLVHTRLIERHGDTFKPFRVTARRSENAG